MSSDRKLGARLYPDPREHQLAVEVRRDLTLSGETNEPKILAAIAKAVEQHQPLWRENPELSIAEDREIRAALNRRQLRGAEAEARKERTVETLRRPIYFTRPKVLEVLAVEKADNRTRQILNTKLNEGAGDSAWLAHLRIGRRAEQMAQSEHAAHKGTFRAKDGA